MANTKHVGRIAKTKKKCGVVYRVVPGEPESCVVVLTESLDAADHDSFINLINSATAQDAYELGEAMSRTQLSDGRNMLAGFHTTGRMIKVATNQVEMTPNNSASVNLSELNNIIAQQKGVTVADLALGGAKVKPNNTDVTNAVDAYIVPTMAAMDESVTTTDGVLDDETLAKQLRSQADALFKEAQRLRSEAEELAPTKKATKKIAESA
jgi:hypothetical protein